MPGSQADEIDWENLSNKELHDKFQQMMTEQVQDVLNNFEEAMEKITGLEKTFETKLDNRFNELLARLPPPPPAAPNAPLQQQQQRLPPRHEIDLRRASRVPLAFGQTVGAAVDTSVAPAADAEEDDYVGDYEDEVAQIRTTCNDLHHNHQVVHMQIITMVGLSLRYEIMTIFLN